MRTAVEILRYGTREPVEAELFDEVTLDDFLETQEKWRPLLVQATKQLVLSGADENVIPRHFHWNWSQKEAELRVLAFSFYGIRCEKELQGLMKVSTVGHVCRHPDQKGKSVVYVDYLETAPWNIKVLMQALGKRPQFAAIGSRLIEAAVRKSLEEGFKGRVALHSLSTSEKFYIDNCEMTALERDPDKEDLLWSEFTPQQAEKFLS